MGLQPVIAEPIHGATDASFRDHMFALSVSGTAFGVLWSGPEGCAVRWPGALDFAELNTQATVELPKHLPYGDGKEAARVTLRLEDGNFSRFTLPAQVQEVTEALSKPGRVSFARYDLRSHYGFPFAAALTVENPADRPGGRGQIGILLPSARSWSPGLLEWILKHHSLGEGVRPIVDLDRSSAVLADLCSASPYV